VYRIHLQSEICQTEKRKAGSDGTIIFQEHIDKTVAPPGVRSGPFEAQPELRLPGFVVRRHGGRLVLEVGSPVSRDLPAMHRWSWRRGALQLAGGKLEIVADLHGDLDLARLPQQLLVQYPSTSGGKSLRKLMQELAVPEWQREHLPVVFAARRAGKPLAIADRWLAAGLRSNTASVRRGRIFWRELL